MDKIVVGIDGSDASLSALRWAIDEARIRFAEVHVVHAWQVPVPAMTFDGVVTPSNVDFKQEAEDAARRLVEGATSMAGDVVITTSAPQGPAAPCLIQAAAGASLLVIGSRGHGGFAGLLLGSVGQQCTHHAPCPVVIVR
jgi:nucleotide-binding universal stress UspA family protein